VVLSLVLRKVFAAELARHYPALAGGGLMLCRVLIHDHLATAEAARKDSLRTEGVRMLVIAGQEGVHVMDRRECM
jgi:hypothetical protein